MYDLIIKLVIIIMEYNDNLNKPTEVNIFGIISDHIHVFGGPAFCSLVPCLKTVSRQLLSQNMSLFLSVPPRKVLTVLQI
jgi:hypothetical protein